LFAELFGDRLVGVLKAYLDESADGTSEHVFVVAGWLGHSGVWEKFIPRWCKRVLSEGVERFHMTRCNSGHEEFHGWPDGRRNALIADLIALICEFELTGFGAGILLEDYRGVKQANPAAKANIWLNNPYFITFNWCIQEMCLAHRGEQIAILNDRHEGVEFRLGEYFNQISDEPAVVYSKQLSSLTFGNSKDQIPLQAADLVAWEVRRELLRRKIGSLLTEREPFVALLPKLNPNIGIFDKRTLEHLFDDLTRRAEARE
jgi:hypothetical protein